MTTKNSNLLQCLSGALMDRPAEAIAAYFVYPLPVTHCTRLHLYPTEHDFAPLLARLVRRLRHKGIARLTSRVIASSLPVMGLTRHWVAIDLHGPGDTSREQLVFQVTTSLPEEMETPQIESLTLGEGLRTHCAA